ncbi:MAG TPA: hypothetical protein VM534_09345, partial [Thermoanaerobaculia bacterium]|nr:hypothetical protein [Thermoanaerobaculia bacterium]
AQEPYREVRGPWSERAQTAVKQAAQHFGEQKKLLARDLEILSHLQNADAALADVMQRGVALQKAYEEVSEAQRLGPEFLVEQGVLRVLGELDHARRNSSSADVERVRGILRSDALGPARRLVARNGLVLQQQTLEWIRVQELIAAHLRDLAEFTGESLRRAE